MVGSVGAEGERFAPVTASARSRPARTCGMVDIALAAEPDTRPATRSRMLGAVPLYGICTSCSPAMRFNISTVKCCPLPLPEDENNTSLGRALAKPISSFTLFTGSDGCTDSTLADCTNSDTGAKSLRVSKLSL